MMETNTVPETLDSSYTLTALITQEDFTVLHDMSLQGTVTLILLHRNILTNHRHHHHWRKQHYVGPDLPRSLDLDTSWE
jgi:hypothetical protein